MATERPTLPRKPKKAYAPRSVNLPEYRVVCDLLRDIRVEAGLTQVEFAQALRRTQTYVSAVERGITRVDPLQLRAWCLAAGTTVERFARRMEKALTTAG